MRFLLIEHVQNGYHSLRTTRLRTLLTVLGVAIGVASVTVILSLSSGVSQVVSRQVDELGGNIAVIRPGSTNRDQAVFQNPTIDRTYIASTLAEKDLVDIKALENVEGVAPLMTLSANTKAGDTIVKDTTLLATTPDLQGISNIKVHDGQFIDASTKQDTAVVGSQLSIDLFGTEQSIGKLFSVRGQTFRVIGVLNRLESGVNFNNIDFNKAAIVSLEAGKSFHQGIAEIQQINVKATSSDSLPSVKQAVAERLLKNHFGEEDFTIVSGKEVAEPSNRFFVALTGVMTAIAAISLVVGGIGIMNIMLVGVAERTREIGLRKAVGASSGTIVWQFLIEALMISFVGGLLGYVSGYILAFILGIFLSFTPSFTMPIAATALCISVGTGVLFGTYPAIRAARKDPIESLRRYH